MARRLKTKVSPCTWRLDATALNALAVLEAQQPDKPRGKLIGEILIAKAMGIEPPPTIQFAELEPADLFSLRGSIAELAKLTGVIKTAVRYATPGSDDEAISLGSALKQINTFLTDGRKVLATVRELISRSASVKVEEIINFKDVYDEARGTHSAIVTQFGKDKDAPKMAKIWENLANFVRKFRPDVGEEIKTPTPFPVEKGAKPKPEVRKPEKEEFEDLEELGGFTDA